MFTSDGGDSTLGWIVLVGAGLQVAVVIAFFVMVAHVGAIRRMLDGTMRDRSHIRVCGFCRAGCEPLASVCPHCAREIGAWTRHNHRWWVQRDGGWRFLDPTTNEWKERGSDDTPPLPT